MKKMLGGDGKSIYKRLFYLIAYLTAIILVIAAAISALSAWLIPKTRNSYPIKTVYEENVGINATKGIELNSATKADLVALSGVGDKTAEAILAMRNEYGPFNYIEDLMAVKGIGKKKLEELKKHIYIEMIE